MTKPTKPTREREYRPTFNVYMPFIVVKPTVPLRDRRGTDRRWYNRTQETHDTMSRLKRVSHTQNVAKGLESCPYC